MFTF
jgi:hypothetical protein